MQSTPVFLMHLTLDIVKINNIKLANLLLTLNQNSMTRYCVNGSSFLRV